MKSRLNEPLNEFTTHSLEAARKTSVLDLVDLPNPSNSIHCGKLQLSPGPCHPVNFFMESINQRLYGSATPTRQGCDDRGCFYKKSGQDWDCMIKILRSNL